MKDCHSHSRKDMCTALNLHPALSRNGQGSHPASLRLVAVCNFMETVPRNENLKKPNQLNKQTKFLCLSLKLTI